MFDIKNSTNGHHQFKPHNPAPDDQYAHIYKVAWLLRQNLVPELVQSVIEYARLFHRQTSTADHHRAVRPSNSPSTCLITTPIDGLHGKPNVIRAVGFRIIAKDQGFVAYPGYGSWTWFTAGILKKGQSEVVHQKEIVHNDSHVSEFVSREIEWSVESSDNEESDWVRKLQQGDRVVVQGWSKYHGWVNFVNLVEVTILTRVVR